MHHEPNNKTVQIYEFITGEEDARACDDIPEESCNSQPRNFILILLGNLFTKLGDELASAKLVFPWVLGLLGAPLFLISLCVPMRESGVLIPQLLVAAKIRLLSRRKWIWAAGSFLTALSLFACAATLLLGIDRTVAQASVMAGLLAFSLARGICSVAAKDVTGKTIAKGRRGTLTGTATSISGALTLLVALGLGQFGDLKSSETLLAILLSAAGVCWLISAAVQLQISEQAGATTGGKNGALIAMQTLSRAFSDREFTAFVCTRTLLLSVSLTLPALVALAQQQIGQSSSLGYLMLASGAANAMSGYFWGRLSDWASHRIMALAAAMNATLIALGLFLMTYRPAASSMLGLMTAWFFMASVALAGVRVGRKTHLMDISHAENRASNVAVSNTVIGVLILILGSAFSGLAGGNVSTLLGLYALLSAGAATMAYRLKHAQK